jgi:hypothetical protein
MFLSRLGERCTYPLNRRSWNSTRIGGRPEDCWTGRRLRERHIACASERPVALKRETHQKLAGPRSRCSVLVLQFFYAFPGAALRPGLVPAPSWVGVGGTRRMPSGEVLGGKRPRRCRWCTNRAYCLLRCVCCPLIRSRLRSAPNSHKKKNALALQGGAWAWLWLLSFVVCSSWSR